MKLHTFPVLCLIMLSSSFLCGMDEGNPAPSNTYTTIKNTQGELVTFDAASYAAYMNLKDKEAFNCLLMNDHGLENDDGSRSHFKVPEGYQLLGVQEVRLGKKLEQPGVILKERIIPQCNGECGDKECSGYCMTDEDANNNNTE